MNTRYTIAIAALLLFTAGSVGFAQEQGEVTVGEETEFSKIGVGTGTFLSIPVGARAVAMGGGFVASASDATSLYWNPAGIMRENGSHVSYSFTSLFAGIDHNFAGASFSIGDQYKLGVSATMFGSDDIEETDLFNPEGTGAFYSARDLSFGLSVAGQLTEQFSFGVTGKYVDLSLAATSASGVAFDFGTMYDPGILGMNIGFAVQNLSAPVKYTGPDLIVRGRTDETTGNREADMMLNASSASLPLTFRAGLGFEFLEDNPDHAVHANTEFSTVSDAPERLALGAEYVWNDLVSLRAGYILGSDDAFGLSGGLGIRYDSGPLYAVLDYAIRPHNTLGLVNVITASVRLQ